MMEIEEDITPSRFRRRRKLICLALAFLITIAFDIYICIIVSAGSRKVSYQNCTSKDLDGATVSICESVVDIQFKKEQFANKLHSKVLDILVDAFRDRIYKAKKTG